jgi:hypothetical protein
MTTVMVVMTTLEVTMAMVTGDDGSSGEHGDDDDDGDGKDDDGGEW